MLSINLHRYKNEELRKQKTEGCIPSIMRAYAIATDLFLEKAAQFENDPLKGNAHEMLFSALICERYSKDKNLLERAIR